MVKNKIGKLKGKGTGEETEDKRERNMTRKRIKAKGIRQGKGTRKFLLCSRTPVLTYRLFKPLNAAGSGREIAFTRINQVKRTVLNKLLLTLFYLS